MSEKDSKRRAYEQGYERGWRESETWVFSIGTAIGWLFGVVIESWLLSIIGIFAADMVIMTYSGK